MSVAEATISIQQVARDLARCLGPASRLLENEPLSKHTTLRVGGPADLYIEPATEPDLAAILAICAERNLPWMMLGRGSNLLVRDGGIRGIVICLAAPSWAEIRVEDLRMICGAGARLRSAAFEAKKSLLTGSEFMEGIPGNIGGALRMNAGAMGGVMFDVLESVRFMDSAGTIHERKTREIPVEYRNCLLFKTHIVLRATFLLQRGTREAIEHKMNLCSQKRWGSQPAAPSAGCIFKNAATIPAGKLIEELGLKGTRCGGALISDVHGNFIVNEGKASARDILELIELVREHARTQRNVDLHTEVQIVGED
jgi:UDP-N-acetylenolpyruvoylglucosamine reductase